MPHPAFRADGREQARRLVEYPWSEGHPISFLELQFYTMRHVQEHVAQLNLFLGQNGTRGASDWVGQGKAEAGGEEALWIEKED